MHFDIVWLLWQLIVENVWNVSSSEFGEIGREIRSVQFLIGCFY